MGYLEGNAASEKDSKPILLLSHVRGYYGAFTRPATNQVTTMQLVNKAASQDDEYTVSVKIDTSSKYKCEGILMAQGIQTCQRKVSEELINKLLEGGMLSHSDCNYSLIEKESQKEIKDKAEVCGHRSSLTSVSKELANDGTEKTDPLENKQNDAKLLRDFLKPPISSRFRKLPVRLNGSMSCTYPIRLKTHILILMVFCSLTEAKSMLPSNDRNVVKMEKFETLSTSLCNPSNIDMTQTCHIQGSDELQLLLDRCQFNCLPGYKPVCVDIDDGMAFICVPVRLRCEKGNYWRITKDEEDRSMVKVIVEKCPTGYYQETKSDCLTACRSRHLDLSYIEEWYLVFSKGDHISPTKVYCNYKKGYYNRGGDFLLDYDRESEHDPYFCGGKVADDNPCVEGQTPLPNGTCVLPCNPNECRDDHDNFICKQNCWGQTEVKHSIYVTKLSDLLTDKNECERKHRVCKNGECKQSYGENVCQCYLGFVNDRKTGKCIGSDMTSREEAKKNLQPAVIALIVTGGVIILIVVVIYIYKKRKRCGTEEDGNSLQLQESSSAVTDECSSVNETDKGKGITPDTEQNGQSVVFKETRDVYITNYFDTNNTKDQQASDPVIRTKGDNSNHSTVIRDHSHEAESKEETEPLLIHSNNGSTLSNFGEFKKATDDTNTEAATRSLNKLLQSCGAIIHNDKFIGSAFRVGPKYVMTAFHVIRNVTRDITGNADYDFSRIEKENLHVNFQDSVLNSHGRNIFLKYRYHNEFSDCAVLEIKDIDMHENLPDPLLLWRHPHIHLGIKEIILIGFGNKNNPVAKHWEKCKIIEENLFQTRHRKALASLEQNKLRYKKDLQRGDQSDVDRGYYGIENENFIKFDCYMEHGLSGAPVITHEVNSPKVIGIVMKGMPDFFYQLSAAMQEKFEKEYLFEIGVKMELIYQSMRREKRNLADEIFPRD